MALKVCRYSRNGGTGWGVVAGETIQPVAADRITVFFGGVSPKSAGAPFPIGEASFLSPIEYPAAVICQGENYAAHIRESGGNVKKEYNTFFMKASSTLASAVGTIARPSFVQLLDYEAEIALVMAKDVTGPVTVTRENLHEFVAGVTLANDVSARDIQIPQVQWFKGKSYRGFCPVGPFVTILDKSDFASLSSAQFRLSVNGSVRQEASYSGMIFPPEATLTELFGLMDVHAGDLVLTGTPSGVALKAPPAWIRRIAGCVLSERAQMQMFLRGQKKIPNYLKKGDRIVARLWSPDGIVDSGEMNLVVEN